MGSSTVFYVGPYIRLTSGITVTETKEIHRCPRCKKTRDGKFCATCGSEIETVSEAKQKVITSTWDVINHIGYIPDDFISFNYDDSELIYNQSSENIKWYDRGDIGTRHTIKEMIAMKERAMVEVEVNQKILTDLLDSFGVTYTIDYGIVIGSL
jgi:hypothetical protein